MDTLLFFSSLPFFSRSVFGFSSLSRTSTCVANSTNPTHIDQPTPPSLIAPNHGAAKGERSNTHNNPAQLTSFHLTSANYVSPKPTYLLVPPSYLLRPSHLIPLFVFTHRRQPHHSTPSTATPTRALCILRFLSSRRSLLMMICLTRTHVLESDFECIVVRR